MFEFLFKKAGYVKENNLFTKVKNKGRYKTANKFYFKAEANGVKYLFTEADLEKAKDRASKNLEDFE